MSDTALAPAWRQKLAKLSHWTGVVTLLVLVVGGTYLVLRVRDDRPVAYSDIEEHFKYGSTGGERGWQKQFGFGIPYWIWVALPQVFPEFLPDSDPDRGYAAFGMIYEDGRDPRFDLPVGMSLRRVQGIDRVYFNCAVCHTGSVRSTPGGPREIVLGMPANTFSLGALASFLNQSAANWKFRGDRIMPKVAELEELRTTNELADTGYKIEALNPLDRAVFRYAGILLMRESLLTTTSRLSFIDPKTWGPGRVDTFNPPKALLGFPMERAPMKEKLGNADFPAVWNQQWKEGMQLHWDGNNTSVDERNLSAGFGTGATPTTIDKESVLRTADWLWDQAQPPSFPQELVDAALATAGEAAYEQYCWSCHGNRDAPYKRESDNGLVGTVTDIAEVGTDRARLDSYTRELAAAQNNLYAGFPEGDPSCDGSREERGDCYPARFSHFRKTNGYANMPLDGLWLRAPYLHNGSVPNLRALLEPVESRPDSFYIGYDVYDYENVGFVTSGPGASADGWLFDTHARGNGKAGHEYGTRELTAEQKNALIEYLKTF